MAKLCRIKRLDSSRLHLKTGREEGFTLVEILVVLVILAILAAVSIPTMRGFIDDAKKKVHLTEARSVYVACQAAASEVAGRGKVRDEDAVKALADEFLGSDIKGEYSFVLDSEDYFRVESVTYIPENGISVTINSDQEVIYGDSGD